MPLTPVVIFPSIVFISFLTCLGGTFFQSYLLLFLCSGDFLLFPFWLTCLLVLLFVIYFYLNTLVNLILVSFIFSCPVDSVTICCYSCDLDSHLSLMRKILYSLYQRNLLILVYVVSVVVLILLVLGVNQKLFVSFHYISLEQVWHHSVIPLTSFGEHLTVDLGGYIKFYKCQSLTWWCRNLD